MAGPKWGVTFTLRGLEGNSPRFAPKAAPIRRRHRCEGHVIIAPMFDLADAPNPELVYDSYLRTCAMLGIRADATQAGIRLDPGMDRSAVGTPGTDDALARRAEAPRYP